MVFYGQKGSKIQQNEDIVMAAMHSRGDALMYATDASQAGGLLGWFLVVITFSNLVNGVIFQQSKQA